MRKTVHQLRVIQISREVDSLRGLTETKRSKYKDPYYQINYYWKNKAKRNENSKRYYARIKEHQEGIREKLKQYNKEYYAANRQRLQQEKKDNYIRRKYGLPRM